MTIVTGQLMTSQVSPIAPVTIYGLRDPRTLELRYIGKATDPERRFRQHLEQGQLNRYRTQKNSWLKNLLAAGHQPLLETIAVVEPHQANETEIHWIAWYRASGARLTNGTAGGDGGAITDPEARARISATHLGAKRTAETRKKMSVSAKARCAEEKERQRLSSISNNKPPVTAGEANPRAKLKDAQVRALRTQAAAGAVLADLAVEYGITRASVTQIVTGQTRVAAGGPIREARPRTVLVDDQVERIRRLHGEGRSQAQLARRFGVSQGHISDLITGKRRAIRPGSGGFLSGH